MPFRSQSMSNQTMITVLASSQPNPTSAQPLNYVFDATIRIEHHQEVHKTDHPVQTGAAISDHAYAQPSRVVLEIGMSDAVEAYRAGMWPTDGNGKSSSAYETILALQLARTLVSLTTRLHNYPSMLITNIQADDTNETWSGLRAVITFEEVFFATVTGVSSTVSPGPLVSARPHTTGDTGLGSVQTIPPSAALIALHQVSEDQAASIGSVPGAGTWSSNIIQK